MYVHAYAYITCNPRCLLRLCGLCSADGDVAYIYIHIYIYIYRYLYI